jgi:signal transduction histidine kinase
VTLRLRMAAIVVTAALMGTVLIVLSYLVVARMFETADQIIDEDLARSQGRAAIHDALERVRRAQDRMGNGPAAGAQGEIVRQIDEVQGLIDTHRRAMPPQGQGSYADMRALLGEVRQVADAWLERNTSDLRAVEVLAEGLEHRVNTVHGRLDDVRLHFAAANRALPPPVESLVQSTTGLISAVESAGFDDVATRRQTPERIHGLVDRARRSIEAARAYSTEPAVQAMISGLADAAEQFADTSRTVVTRATDLQKSARELRARRDDLLLQLGAGADALIIDLARDVQQRRSELAVRRYNLLYVLGLAWLIGLAILSALVVVFASGLEHDVAELMDVARAMERGELAPRSRLDRATRELAEVGRAFSRLAGTLAAVREKQTSYNRIVTGLNRNVFLHEIMRVSLTELCRATRSKAGCVYLKVTGRDELLLAETYAIPRGAAMPEFVRMGEGLVGEVARSQETLITDDLPRSTLKIVSATVDAEIGSLALVPIVYKDELMGVLELATLQKFDKDSVHFVEDVVFQIAVAINNARAIETIRTNQVALQNKTIELEELNAALEHANELKSEFLATVSHELRTPLNAIIGFSELVLETDRHITTSTRENLQKVLRNGENLLALINDILDLSKIEAHHMAIEGAEFDPRQLVREVVADFEPVAARKAIGLRCDTEDGPPLVHQDLEKLRRIVLNLVSNAVKFTEVGEVSIRLFRASDKLRIEVRDTGIGIEADNLARIFEKFRQADGSVTRRFGGTGLGLAITKELCHLMGGSVRVFSQPGRGSTFTVTLPTRLPGPGALPDDSHSLEVALSPTP